MADSQCVASLSYAHGERKGEGVGARLSGSSGDAGVLLRQHDGRSYGRENAHDTAGG